MANRIRKSLSLLILFGLTTIQTLLAAQTPTANEPDTLKMVEAEVVTVTSSSKETNSQWKRASAMSIISPFKAQQRNITDVKDLSSVVPNLFIPDYGSRMTTPVFLRGVGTRSSGQSVGLYVDDIPYMDKSTFDFEFMDIQRIEVLRGPQGTLYGRNAMGGLINVYTLSPFDYQGTKISVGAGSYNSFNGKVSSYHKLNEKMAFSVSGYWDSSDGYFTNDYSNTKADNGWNAGARAKFEWEISDRLSASLSMSYDYTNQNAFPYGQLDEETGEIANPNYNDLGTYKRNMSNNSLHLEYRADNFIITSNTGYQWLYDDMWMDTDYSPSSIFTLNQRQLQNSINQELTIKSATDGNYQWSAGFFGFYNSLKTLSEVNFKEDGVNDIISVNLPSFITITDTELPNPGDFYTPSYGLALFHQSTFNNILTEGLSATVGLRLDYEKQYIDYYTIMQLNGLLEIESLSTIVPFVQTAELEDNLSQHYLRLLPKVAITYEFSPEAMIYASAAKGYKAGGYNTQMFSEVMQDEINPTSVSSDDDPTIEQMISYKPESTWSYELGGRGRFCEGRLSGELALFYMDVTDMQLTQFVDSGSGRILTNAGHGESYGVEVSLSGNPWNNFFVDASYGYTHSTFKDYTEGVDEDGVELDYSGNFTPYVPMHTFSVGASYSFNFKGWLRSLTLSAQYTGNGKIYWDEANSAEQPFYGLVNAKLSFLTTSGIRLDLWGNNLTSTEYGAFYFESFGIKYLQQGRPMTCGVSLSLAL
ncbi:MAG: TonB-dependent receptor [Rikenellaceae bacterium]